MVAIWNRTHDADTVHSLSNTRCNIAPRLWVEN